MAFAKRFKSCSIQMKKVAIITGGSNGFGKQLAIRLNSLGYCLVLGDLVSSESRYRTVG